MLSEITERVDGLKSKEIFLEISSLFPVKNFPQEKIFSMKNFTCRTHFSKCKLKLKSRQPFRNDIPIVNMAED